MRKAVVQHLNPPPGQRLLAVSDVHGNPEFLSGLLEQAAFCEDDALFLLGDFLEKGAESLGTLRLVMDLSRRYEVHILCGNCDDLVVGFVDGREELEDEFFDFYLQKWGDRCTLHQMGAEIGLTEADMKNYPLFRAALRENFRRELDFLRELPTIIETEHLIFVHGGVPSGANMEALEAWRCMKNDDFLLQESHLEKYCIVGHTPVTLYHAHIPSASPIICREKKIISIDGGCSLKADGQLNLLILPQEDSEDFRWISWDGLPQVTALEEQASSRSAVNIRWGRSRVEVLASGPEFTRCRHLETGRELDILTDYLYEKQGQTRCEDSTDYRLPVAPGDRLSVVRSTSKGLLAKKDGATGWYGGRFEPINR
ncbi:MAG: metallophosphoesterase [Pseudoflavonifractor sp.]